LALQYVYKWWFNENLAIRVVGTPYLLIKLVNLRGQGDGIAVGGLHDYNNYAIQQVCEVDIYAYMSKLCDPDLLH
jgi:hypothetical protein